LVVRDFPSGSGQILKALEIFLRWMPLNLSYGLGRAHTHVTDVGTKDCDAVLEHNLFATVEAQD